MERPNLKGMTLAQMRDFVSQLGERPYRGAQLFSWIYAKRASSFEEMTDISQEFRHVLAGAALLENLRTVASNTSLHDGTTKFLFALRDDLNIESVLIPAEENAPDAGKRLTLCMSTQVGCPLDCAFCATGTMGLVRNLTAGEIVDQLIQVLRTIDKRITNLVYMGMGEPMLNYDAVMTSIEIIAHDRSLHISPRHITVSTAGYANRIRQMADEGRRAKLALSLHSLVESKRTALMPITKKFGVEELVDSLDYYFRKTRQRPTIEYIPFEGYNDTTADATRLIALARRVPCKVNLIPYHSIAFTHPAGFAATLRPASPSKIAAFAERLRSGGVTVMVRSSAGEDINAACGQLAVKHRSPRMQSASRQRKSVPAA
ncbi:MAG: 23S rRNA (adenine(2503)-C(2))-methyltransferase [Ignavibacteria bacterium RIFCSPLOWO2_02_FULL_55_14]|nr:MAG: 23S rRNA (adenine(2503)-C(2))-methyltransferase [Ignavibacteria bacterium RIFCSPLOWO2_02_FULL_55_14]